MLQRIKISPPKIILRLELYHEKVFERDRGMIAGLNVSEQKFNESMKKLENTVKRARVKISYEYVFYDDLNGMLMGPGSGLTSTVFSRRWKTNFVARSNPTTKI